MHSACLCCAEAELASPPLSRSWARHTYFNTQYYALFYCGGGGIPMFLKEVAQASPPHHGKALPYWLLLCKDGSGITTSLKEVVQAYPSHYTIPCTRIEEWGR